jgi:hypothetical protein
MKKPSWISACGWLCVAILTFCFAGWLIGSQAHLSVDFSAALWMLFMFAFPLFAVWALASIVHGVMAHKAAIETAKMQEYFKKNMPQVGDRGQAPAPGVQTSPLGLGRLAQK